MDIGEIAFLASFLPCSFEGFEMSMFWSLASLKDKAKANLGVVGGVVVVTLMLYLTYILLPTLVSDVTEYYTKLLLGFLLLSLATYFLYKGEYPEPKGAFLVAFLGIIAEGLEVDVFSVSSWIMTGSFLGIIGGFVGFLWSLFALKGISLKIPKQALKTLAVIILYSVGFIVLTSGLV
ncbi:hypothetical protein [Stygiolobus caldivivus]|uniref:Uncharacterized protein n=1 Tax=Stygiolobus caldivivus TaxID=2824673 RepID=A0A8D5U8S7_9CREN|nr:hypothetical protein [Stygiolobus caldivivus]BCU70851.1 hypothetical protein KN1_21480 [Stygiolobus caldivivus]